MGCPRASVLFTDRVSRDQYNANGGHYVAYVRESNDLLRTNNRWFLVDDIENKGPFAEVNTRRSTFAHRRIEGTRSDLGYNVRHVPITAFYVRETAFSDVMTPLFGPYGINAVPQNHGSNRCYATTTLACLARVGVTAAAEMIKADNRNNPPQLNIDKLLFECKLKNKLVGKKRSDGSEVQYGFGDPEPAGANPKGDRFTSEQHDPATLIDEIYGVMQVNNDASE